MGNVDEYPWVAMMNILATRAALCMAIAISRRCYFAIENPDRSTVTSFPYFDYLLKISHYLDIYAGVPDRCQRIFWYLICMYDRYNI